MPCIASSGGAGRVRISVTGPIVAVPAIPPAKLERKPGNPLAVPGPGVMPAAGRSAASPCRRAGLAHAEVALSAGKRHGAMADDRGPAADHDLGDPAALFIGGALQHAGAPHGHSLVDPEMIGAIPLR